MNLDNPNQIMPTVLPRINPRDELPLFDFPVAPAIEDMEDELIAALNPPLNLSKNANLVNSEIRALISRRRSDIHI